GAIANQWLEVIVRGNDAAGGFSVNAGLAASDIFFFGNRIGDTGTGTATLALTSATDEIAARGNQGAGASVTNVFDFDKSGTVTATDQIISRGNVGSTAKINISSPPGAPQVDGSLAAIPSALGSAPGRPVMLAEGATAAPPAGARAGALDDSRAARDWLYELLARARWRNRSPLDDDPAAVQSELFPLGDESGGVTADLLQAELLARPEQPGAD